MKDKAKERLLTLETVQKLVENNTPKCNAYKIVSKVTGKHPATLRRWAKLTENFNRTDWLPALCPRWAGNLARAECSPEAWDYLKSSYLNPEKPALAACYERLMRIAPQNDWIVPSLRTIRRRVENEIPRAVRILAREGRRVLMQSFPPQKRDHSVFHAMEAGRTLRSAKAAPGGLRLSARRTLYLRSTLSQSSWI